MKRLLSVFHFILISIAVFSQTDTVKSDLRITIDSIIKYEIGYEIDATTDFIPKIIRDTTKILQSFSSFPSNPMTLLLVVYNKESKSVSLEAINQYQLNDVSKITYFQKNDTTVTALYGSQARNGLIFIHLKKRRRIHKKFENTEQKRF